MKKLALVALVALLLVPLLAAPADARWRHGRHGHRGGFWIGVGVGALVTAPWWYYPAYSYPAYSYPAYSYPVYYPYPVYYGYPAYTPTYTTEPAYTVPPATTTPTPQPLSPAPQGGAEAAPPPQTSQSCQTVWVEGHYETRVMPNGQRVTVWVPAHSQQICQ